MVEVTHPALEESAEKKELAAILIPGDRELDPKRLEAALEPAEFTLASDKIYAQYDFLEQGFVGPRALNSNGVKVFADPRVVKGSSWITGADAQNCYVVGCVAGRDFHVDEFVEAAEVKEGDPAPDNQGTLALQRGIELGHIFQLGRKYTEAFDVQILDENGKRAIPTMGSYGIGISRMLAVLAEQRHDEKGLNWPVAVAPYQVHVAVANKDAAAMEAGDKLVEELSQAGPEGLFDDRSAGSGADPIDYAATFDGADPANSNHPVFRTRRVAYAKKARRAHLSVVPDANSEDSSSSAAEQDTATESESD